MDNISCCAAQCKSKSSKGKTFYEFPRQENLRKLWAQKLKVHTESNEKFYVCSSHFHPKDFKSSALPSMKPLLKRGAIPSQNLPDTSNKITSRRTLGFKNRITPGIRKARKKSLRVSSEKEKNPNRKIGSSNSADDASACRGTAKTRTDSAPEAKEMMEATISNKFEFVDVSKLKTSTPVTSTRSVLKFPPRTPGTSTPGAQRFRPNILRRQENVNKSRNHTEQIGNQKSKSVGTQTELTSDPESLKMDFCKILEILRKVIVGNKVTVKEDTFRIDECTMSFKNEKNPDEELSILIIQSDKFITSGKLVLDSLMEHGRFERVTQAPKPSGQHISSKPAASPKFEHSDDRKMRAVGNQSNKCGQAASQKIELSSNEKMSTAERLLKKWKLADSQKSERNDDATMKIFESPFKKYQQGAPQKSVLRDKNTSIVEKCEFDKEPKVVLKKLPKNLVETAENGISIPVITKTFLRNGIRYRKYVVTHSDIMKSVKNNQNKCEMCLTDFQTVDDLNEHKKKHEAGSHCASLAEHDYLKRSDSELAAVQDSSLQNQSEAQNTSTLDKTNSSEENNKNVNIISVVELLPSKTKQSGKILCSICLKEFRYSCSRAFHERTVHGKNVEVEEHRPEDFVKPEQCCRPKIPEKCPECGETLQDSKELDKHLLQSHQIVLKKSSYICDLCQRDFITYRSLMYHQEKFHYATVNQDVAIKVKCKTCEKLFEVEYYYKSLHSKKCCGTSDAGEQKKCEFPKILNTPCKRGNHSEEEESDACYIDVELLESYKETEINKEHDESATRALKRKYPSIGEEEDTKMNKRMKEVFNDVEALLESAEGSNEIIIIDIDAS